MRLVLFLAVRGITGLAALDAHSESRTDLQGWPSTNLPPASALAGPLQYAICVRSGVEFLVNMQRLPPVLLA